MNVGQGDKAVFRQRITEACRLRAKQFVTQVGLAGRYETFMLEGRTVEVKVAAVGSACRLGFEEFLDGRITFGDLSEVILEGMDDYIYREIAKALADAVDELPTNNKVNAASFDQKSMDRLLAIADSYAGSPATIYCTYEFAATMIPADASWASSDMKSTLWERGYLGTYKGHQVVILRQSMVDATNNKGAKYFVQVLTVDDTRKPLFDSSGKPVIDQSGNPVMVPVISPEAIQEQRDLNVPEEIVQQEYYCSFEAGMVGAYYTEAITKLEKEGRAQKNPALFNPDLPVYTAWDVGFTDSMAIWYFQIDKKNIKLHPWRLSRGVLILFFKKEVIYNG